MDPSNNLFDTQNESSNGESLFELKWDDFQCTLATACSHLREHEDLVDVSLASGGRRWSAHKLILCAASPWFKNLLMNNSCKHPIIILTEDYEGHLSSILDFIYSGCVKVPHSSLKEFLQLAEYLQITGLAESNEIDSVAYNSTIVRKKHKLPPDDSMQMVDNGYGKKARSNIIPSHYVTEENPRNPNIKPCLNIRVQNLPSPNITEQNPPSPNFTEQNLPSPSTPYTLLEPKLEILEDPVQYSDLRNEADCLDATYDRSYSSHQDYHQNVANYNQQDRSNIQEQSYESSQNSLQDLMCITGRLKDVDASRNVQGFANPSIEAGPLACNSSSSSGYLQRTSSYSSSGYNTRQADERSIVPYVPQQLEPKASQRANKSAVQNLRWEEPRFCPACQKSYSNNSNFRRHFKYVPACLSKLEALGYPLT